MNHGSVVSLHNSSVHPKPLNGQFLHFKKGNQK